MSLKMKALFDAIGLDQVYINVKNETCPWHKEAKTYFQNLYEIYSSYLDKDFIEEFSRDFYSRLWELTIINYLGTQSNKGVDLVRVVKPSEGNPDFSFVYQDQKFYVEATCASPGEKLNLNIPFSEIEGKARKIPITEYKESLASVIKEKIINKYNSAYKNYIARNDGFVVAISLAKIPFYHQPLNFNIDLSCLFPISDIKIPIIKNNNLELKMGLPYREFQDSFCKNNGSLIETNYFFNEKFSYVSAVLISHCDLVFFPDIDKYNESCIWRDSRNDFILIHNPFAKTPLPKNFFPVAREVVAKIEGEYFYINITDH